MWAEPGKRMCSNVQAVFLTDEAEPGGAVVVIQASITVKVSTVFIPSKTVPSPAVRLPRSPSPENAHSLRGTQVNRRKCNRKFSDF